jgi:hypothetical protein
MCRTFEATSEPAGRAVGVRGVTCIPSSGVVIRMGSTRSGSFVSAAKSVAHEMPAEIDVRSSFLVLNPP